jgi:hypothetical protein
MSEYALTVTVLQDDEVGTPVKDAVVSGKLVPTKTDSAGTAVVDTVLITVNAEGFRPYVEQPYVRPVIEAPITIRLQRQPILSPKPGPLGPVSRLQGRRTGLVRVDNHSLVDDGGPYLGLCATLFWAGWGFEHDRARLEQNLRMLSSHQVDAIRVLAVIDWPERGFGPQASGDQFDASLAGLTDLAYDTYGMRVEWTIFGGGGVLRSAADREQAVRRVAAVAATRPQKIHAIEVANEAWSTGWSGNEAEARRLARILQDATANLVMVTSPSGADPAAVAPWYDGSLSASRAIVPFHLPRDANGPEGKWRAPRQVRDPIISTPLAWANDEPIGPQSSVVADDDPLRLTMGAALTWLAKGAWHTLHTGAGVQGGGPQDLARGRCANIDEVPNIVAILDGINAVRAVLPADLANWTFGNNNKTFPQYPFEVDPIIPMVEDGRLLRAFGAVNGDRFIVMPIVAKVDVPFKPVRPSHTDILDPMTGRLVESHDGAFTWHGDAAIFLGRTL